jgi:cytochrome c oxidase assembly protein subunit 15
VELVSAVRAFDLSPATFRRLAVAAALSLYLIVISGATVRLTSSGLACESWPGCEPGSFFPATSGHGYVEFGNRIASLFPIVLTLAAWITSYRVPALGARARRLAAATFLGTITQAPLGLLTIKSDLHPLMVMSHFLLALVVLAGGVALVVEAWRTEAGAALPLLAAPLRRAALVFAAAALALVVTGTLATAAGPHPGGSDIRRLGNLIEAVDVHVQVAAVYGIMLLVAVAYVVLRRRRTGLLPVALALLAVTVAQAIVGETQWRTQLPWGLVLVHVALAAAIWALSVLLVYAAWRPPRPFAGT